ncbi:hypothetical protein CAEBREN_20905 [Caenorhabditis brenneri]|uniref:Uncharacterized protein n=1 Tax=Caenorhabditis brenneri TaxID=135651 RepID=G0N1A5_CAEBE|nr:hypothetical protein CAEBREN_20905 [Caenorhabditis brenneri]
MSTKPPEIFEYRGPECAKCETMDTCAIDKTGSVWCYSKRNTKDIVKNRSILFPIVIILAIILFVTATGLVVARRWFPETVFARIAMYIYMYMFNAFCLFVCFPPPVADTFDEDSFA